MALPSLPAELVHNIVAHTAPLDGWGKYWPSKRPVREVRAWLALRLVCKEFNTLILDHLSTQPVLLADLDSALLQRADPPTPAASRMCRRLLLWHVERTRAGARVNEVSLAFAREVIGVVECAVAVLGMRGEGQVGDAEGEGGAEAQALREVYTEGVVRGVVGFSGVAKPVLEGVAGLERDEGGDGDDDDDDDDEDEMDDDGEDDKIREGDEDETSARNGPETGDARAKKHQEQYYLNMALTTAALLGRVEDMKVLIDNGADPAFDGGDGWLGSPQHGAAIGDGVETMQELVCHTSVNRNAECVRTGNTPLHYAAQNGNLEAVEWLLGGGALADEINEAMHTPLFLAAASGHADIVRELLGVDAYRKKIRQELDRDDGCPESSDSDYSDAEGRCPSYVEVDMEDFRGRTPMLMAVERGNLAVVEELMCRADLDINRRNAEEYNMSYLATAASKGYEAIFRHLLSHIDIEKSTNDSSGHGLLKHAAVGGNESIVREVLTWDNVDVNQRGADQSTPVMWAAICGHESIVKLLIEHGADVNLVSSQLHLQMMRLWSTFADPTQNVTPDPELGRAMMGEVAVLVGASALDAAVHGGHEETVKLLIAQPGIELDRGDLDERTPLANAALTGHEGVVALLLAQGDAVNPEARDKDGCTPLMLAARAGDEAVVKVLLRDARVSANSTDKSGAFALAHAAKRGQRDVVRVLLKAGAHSRPEVEFAITLAKEDLYAAESSLLDTVALLTAHLKTMPDEQ
ncbi:ankyrin [Aspergillus heterothallicus]